MHEVNSAGPGIEYLDLLTALKPDAGPAQRRFDADRRLMVDEPAIDNGLAV
jgi:hypothetical protein